LTRAALALALLVAGCEVTVPEGRIACSTAADCPDGWSCAGGRCFSAATDAGDVARDAGDPADDAGPSMDAGDTDAGPVDAGDPMDAGPMDAGPSDAGPEDGGGGCAAGYVPDGAGGCTRDCTTLACGSPPEGCTEECANFRVFEVPFDDLPDCEPSTWRASGSTPFCHTAADAWCVANAGPNWVAGWGPIGEPTAGLAEVVCMAGVFTIRSLGWGTLATSPGCSRPTFGSNCREGVHNLCRMVGDLTGVPLPGDTDEFRYVCLPTTAGMELGLGSGVLGGPTCAATNETTRGALGCMELSHGSCLGLGPAVTGIGIFPPITTGDAASAICLNPR